MPSKTRPLIAIAVASLGWSMAAAQPAATLTSAFVSRAGYNLHGPGDDHAQGEHLESRVELRRTGARVEIVDAGERREYASARDRPTYETIARWRHRWTGRWTRAGGAVRLALEVASSSCVRERRRDEVTESSEACPRLEDATLRCTPADDHAAWSCSGELGPRRRDARLGHAEHTPAPWTFAVSGGCLERIGGTPLTGPPTIAPCPP